MKTLISAMLMFLCVQAYSQTDSTAVFYMPKLKIYQNEKGKVINYFFENDYTRFDVTPSRLIADTLKYNYSVELHNIRKLSFRYGSSFAGAAFHTGAAGFVLGFVVGGYFTLHGSPKFNLNHAIIGGALFALPFALIGGIIGAFIPGYDDYEVNKIPAVQKRTYIMKLLKKYGRMKK